MWMKSIYIEKTFQSRGNEGHDSNRNILSKGAIHCDNKQTGNWSSGNMKPNHSYYAVLTQQ
jgi:hypothetical protein